LGSRIAFDSLTVDLKITSFEIADKEVWYN